MAKDEDDSGQVGIRTWNSFTTTSAYFRGPYLSPLAASRVMDVPNRMVQCVSLCKGERHSLQSSKVEELLP